MGRRPGEPLGGPPGGQFVVSKSDLVDAVSIFYELVVSNVIRALPLSSVKKKVNQHLSGYNLEKNDCFDTRINLYF